MNVHALANKVKTNKKNKKLKKMIELILITLAYLSIQAMLVYKKEMDEDITGIILVVCFLIYTVSIVTIFVQSIKA